jgi:hypothetical protein
MSTEDEPGGNHARGAVFLSGARPRRNAVSPYLGITIDQIIAQKWGQDTIVPSIQLGVEDAGNYGNCNWGYSCAYTNSVSWTSATQFLPTEINPRIAFERLFGAGSTPEERLAGRRKRASILDSVQREIPGLKKDLPPADQARLDAYLENIRELERRIQIAINVRPHRSGFPGRHHALRDHDDGRGHLGCDFPGIRYERGMAWNVASRR